MLHDLGLMIVGASLWGVVEWIADAFKEFRRSC